MKEKIKNRDGKNISVVIEENKNQTGLVFLVHGLGGCKEQKFLEESKKNLYALGYSVVCYDSTNTFGESDGEFECALTTQYLHDLEDVILWSKDKEWYQPFLLVGHSLGGLIISRYAEHNQVEEVVVLNPAIFGRQENKKCFTTMTNPLTGKVHYLNKDFVEDYVQYDLVLSMNALAIRKVVICGDKDYSKNKERYDEIQCELIILKDSGHNFNGKEEEVGRSVGSWVQENMIE